MDFRPEDAFIEAANECKKMAKSSRKTSKFAKGYMMALAEKKGLDVDRFISSSDSE